VSYINVSATSASVWQAALAARASSMQWPATGARLRLWLLLLLPLSHRALVLMLKDKTGRLRDKSGLGQRTGSVAKRV